MTQQFNGIGCASVADIEIPSSGGSYFKLTEGVHKIRVLQGPVINWLVQEWDDGKPVGEKEILPYSETEKPAGARIMMTFLIWDYKEKAVLIWEVAQKTILEQIKNINGIQPDLSAFDLQITRSDKGRTTYSIAQGPNSPFTVQEAINEVMQKNIIERLKELKSNDSTLEAQEREIQAEIAARKASSQTSLTTTPTPIAPQTEATVETVKQAFQ
ncbi:MAG TPA: hypothetical protein PKC87_00210 [Candidatus Absconditabacterales bacterium]|nr:hypothetical protein [Candidatus Absconditabacterales bacterium]